MNFPALVQTTSKLLRPHAGQELKRASPPLLSSPNDLRHIDRKLTTHSTGRATNANLKAKLSQWLHGKKPDELSPHTGVGKREIARADLLARVSYDELDELD